MYFTIMKFTQHKKHISVQIRLTFVYNMVTRFLQHDPLLKHYCLCTYHLNIRA